LAVKQEGMPGQLEVHIRKLLKTDVEELPEIMNYFKPVQASRKQNLLVEGKICSQNYFVEKGCLRLYFVNEKGIEQTVQFALENWWLSDYSSLISGQPSGFNIQAVEHSELLSISTANQDAMLDKYPVMEKYFRLVHQRAHAAFQFRIKFLYNLSREELYNQFNDTYPEFVQRIPQYLLASFLGFTPEYLSEIRRKKLS
jgi:CRP-like cAMP-binding protein